MLATQPDAKGQLSPAIDVRTTSPAPASRRLVGRSERCATTTCPAPSVSSSSRRLRTGL